MGTSNHTTTRPPYGLSAVLLFATTACAATSPRNRAGQQDQRSRTDRADQCGGLLNQWGSLAAELGGDDVEVSPS